MSGPTGRCLICIGRDGDRWPTDRSTGGGTTYNNGTHRIDIELSDLVA